LTLRLVLPVLDDLQNLFNDVGARALGCH
jgi:hypothetical protein